MKLIATTMLAFAVSSSVCASNRIDEKGEVRIETNFNSVQHTADNNGLLATHVEPKKFDLGQRPYTLARVTVFRSVNGEEKVLASKIVPLDQSIQNYSGSMDYIGECTKMENKEPNCTTASTPIGLMAHVQYISTPKNSAPVYRIALGWRVLERLSKFEIEDSGFSIEMPEISSREILDEVVYKKPIEFKGYDDQNINTVMRLELM